MKYIWFLLLAYSVHANWVCDLRIVNDSTNTIWYIGADIDHANAIGTSLWPGNAYRYAYTGAGTNQHVSARYGPSLAELNNWLVNSHLLVDGETYAPVFHLFDSGAAQIINWGFTNDTAYAMDYTVDYGGTNLESGTLQPGQYTHGSVTDTDPQDITFSKMTYDAEGQPQTMDVVTIPANSPDWTATGLGPITGGGYSVASNPVGSTQTTSTNGVTGQTASAIGNAQYNAIVQGLSQLHSDLNRANGQLSSGFSGGTNQSDANLDNMARSVTNLANNMSATNGLESSNYWQSLATGGSNQFQRSWGDAFGTNGLAAHPGLTNSYTADDAFWRVSLLGTNTIDLAPWHNAKMVEMATWIKKVLTWFVTLLFVIGCMKIMFDAVDQLWQVTQTNGTKQSAFGWNLSLPSGLVFAAFVVTMVANFAVLGALFWGPKLASLTAVASSPMISSVSWVQQAIVLAYFWLPMDVIIAYGIGYIVYWVWTRVELWGCSAAIKFLIA